MVCFLFYVFAWRHTILVFEVLGEALGGVVAYLIGYFGNGEAAFLQQLTGALQADEAHKIKRCNAREGINLLEEFVALDVQLVAQYVDGEVRIANVLLDNTLSILQKLLIER